MALPAGVDKESGLTAALEELGLSPAELVGVGERRERRADAAIRRLRRGGGGAEAALKRHASVVLEGAAGAGVVELIGRLLAGDLPAARRPASAPGVILLCPGEPGASATGVRGTPVADAPGSPKSRQAPHPAWPIQSTGSTGSARPGGREDAQREAAPDRPRGGDSPLAPPTASGPCRSTSPSPCNWPGRGRSTCRSPAQVRVAAALYDRARLQWLPSVSLGADYLRHDGRIQLVPGEVVTSSRSSFMAGGGLNAVVSLSDAFLAPLAARQDCAPAPPGSTPRPTTPPWPWPRPTSACSRPAATWRQLSPSRSGPRSWPARRKSWPRGWPPASRPRGRGSNSAAGGRSRPRPASAGGRPAPNWPGCSASTRRRPSSRSSRPTFRCNSSTRPIPSMR